MRQLLRNTTFVGLTVAAVVLLLPSTAQAQRMSHGSRGGSASRARPSAQPSRPTSRPSRPSTQPSRPTTQPSRPGAQPSRQPSSSQRPTINGSNQNSGNRARPSTRPTNPSGNAGRGGNTINIDNSRNTTVVRNNSIRYNRPPHVYGGHRYYAYHPYYYHPYRPYSWGPAWHPWGYFVARIATTAIIISIANQQYHYDSGVYYTASSGGYTVVQAPVGATITTLPANAEPVVVNETTNNYYYGGTYYEKSDGGYTVVPPTAGTIVENLPEGAEEVKVGDQTYVKYGETYYLPVQKDGKNVYEVVDVQPE